MAGVLSGAHDVAALEAAEPDAVLPDVTALAAALSERGLLPALAPIAAG